MVEQRCPVHTDAGCVVRLESLQLRCVLELALWASSALEQWSCFLNVDSSACRSRDFQLLVTEILPVLVTLFVFKNRYK